MISIFIPTKNEAQDLPGCLKSVSWSDDIHVYDSGSTDLTGTVAAWAGAHVTLRCRDLGQDLFGGNEAEHKNWALASIPFKFIAEEELMFGESTSIDLCSSYLRILFWRCYDRTVQSGR